MPQEYDSKEIMINHKIKVDDCIADEILELNNNYNILTLASCCGHGEDDGFIVVHNDMYDSTIDDIGSDILKMLKLGYKFKDFYTYNADSMSKNKKLTTWRKRTVPCFLPKSKCKCKAKYL